MASINNKLSSAVKKGDADKVKTLMLETKCDARFKDKYGWTALMWAAAYGQAPCVSLLLPVSDLLAKDHRGFTALMYAAIYGQTSCVSLLLPVSDVLAKDRSGRSASELAVKKSHYALARLIDAFTLAQSERLALNSWVPAVTAPKKTSRRV